MPVPRVSIELRHLRYFLAVVEELHFGRAAERLHIAQPPLSQAIRKLEDELGVQLFNRTSRVVTTTEAGRELAAQAVAVLGRFDVAVAETRRAGGLTDGLRAGCIPHLSLERLGIFLEALGGSDSTHPQVTHLGSVEQVNRLRSGKLDVGIFDDIGELPGLELHPLFPGEPLAAFLPTDHPLTTKSALGPDDLKGDVLVTYPRDANPALFDRLLKILEDAGFGFAGMQEASSKNGRDLMLAVAEGLGVAIGPAPLMSVIDAGKLVCPRSLDPQPTMPDTVIAWREDPARHLGAQLANVRRIARELRASKPARS
jgi:DNA-binding transcriptional LysR family regulator